MDFKHIGTALRWLRTQRLQKQREVARSAGITPAMLSAYETGKHRPSLDTTERVLEALGCDVVDLTNALQMVIESERRRQPEARQPRTSPRPSSQLQGRFHDLVRQTLESAEVTPEEEAVLVSMLPGLLRLVRHLKS
ncbi:MAG: helix-turn-helix transcriptional regulator [Acidobacteria bacterium]|nr:helix-turn-helix transcriptional regulator [Acidobacteriota bacterium]